MGSKVLISLIERHPGLQHLASSEIGELVGIQIIAVVRKKSKVSLKILDIVLENPDGGVVDRGHLGSRISSAMSRQHLCE